MRKVPPAMGEKMRSAAKLFVEVGLDGTKMEDIAVTTGVPKATLYYYFEGKEDILSFLFLDNLDEVEQAIEEAMARPGTAAERLRAAVIAHLQVFEHSPEVSLALQFDIGRAARTPIINERIESAFRAPIRRLLEEGIADGSFRRMDHPRLVATAVLGAVTTVGINAVALGATRPLENIADSILDVVLRGVAL
jgi:TetR/AcrR family transcriptional regulator